MEGDTDEFEDGTFEEKVNVDNNDGRVSKRKRKDSDDDDNEASESQMFHKKQVHR